MQQLNRDQQQELIPEAGGLTLADVVGYDQDTPFKSMMQFTVSNDINHISVGGTAALGQGVNFTCRLMEEGGLHDLMSYGLVFNCKLFGTDEKAYFFQNALSLFEAVYLKIGQKQISLARHNIYQQMYLYSMNKSAVQPYAYGLGLDTNEYDNLYDSANGFFKIIQQKALSVVRRTNAQDITALATNGGNGVLGIQGDSSFYVPLFMIVPELLTVDQQLYTAMGQTIEIGIRTQQYNKCIFNYDGTDDGSKGQYTLTNISLIRQFAMLDSVHNDMVKRSELLLRPVQSMQFNVSPLSQSINLNFAISRGSKMRQLLFSFVPTNSGQGKGNSANAPCSLMQTWQGIAEAPNPVVDRYPNFIWGEQSLFLALPIQQIEIDAAGDRVVYNSQQISCLQLLSGSQTHNTLGDFMDAYHGCSVVSQLERNIKQVYRVDLDRFPIDEIGSTAQGQVQVLVKIVLATGLQGTTGQYQNTIQVCDGQTFSSQFANIASSLTCQAYLEYQDDIHLTHGIYQ